MRATDFRFPAGRPSLDLVATVRFRLSETPLDRLSGLDAAHRWCELAKMPVAEPLRRDDLVRLRSLREALYELLRVRVGAEYTADVDDHIQLVNDFARKSPPAPVLELTDNSRLVSAAPEFTAAHTLALLARDGIDVLSGPDADRLRQCEADPCGIFFFDSARGPHRRWCSSETCGNRARVSAYRARQTT